MKQFAIITAGVAQTSSLTACKAILEDQHLSYSEIADVKGAVTLSRGKINPACGYVIVSPDETILLDYLDLVAYLRRTGLCKI